MATVIQIAKCRIVFAILGFGVLRCGDKFTSFYWSGNKIISTVKWISYHKVKTEKRATLMDQRVSQQLQKNAQNI